jgi:ABC-type branched-subunit amino acid transport system ATPase component
MIKTFRAQNYGCLKDVTMGLTPLHAFVGPNDSGKSTILRGIRTVVQFAGGYFRSSNDGWSWLPFNPVTPGRRVTRKGSVPDPTDILLGCGVAEGWYAIIQEKGNALTEVLGTPDTPIGGPPFRSQIRREFKDRSTVLQEKQDVAQSVSNALTGVRMLRLDPDALRMPSPLIDEPVDFLDDRGDGLAGVYQAILGRGDEASDEIRNAIRRLFPSIKRIGVTTSSTSSRKLLALEGELVDGCLFDASEMSEGLLYFLAYSLVPYLSPVSVLLIEEPENGLHPARIQEVIRSLRAFAETTGTQVLMATHSPLVVNELTPDEVSVVTKASVEEGTKVTRIKDTPNFEKRFRVYTTGELWLAYADGNVEAPLFEGGTLP